MASDLFDGLIIDDKEQGVFRVSRRAFSDTALYESEARSVFGKCWLYVGHASEVPQPGSFQVRKVVGRSLILVRDGDGEVRVFYNTCRHRGAVVCRAQSGTTRFFQCPYHGWTYNTKGALTGVPGESAYGAGFARESFGLMAPRTETYRGFVFINFSNEAPGLIDYLAGAREYLDLICDQGDMEILPGSQLYGMNANWKLVSENNVDPYHLPTLHKRFMRHVRERGADMSKRVRKAWRELGHGHMALESSPMAGRPLAHWYPGFGEASKKPLEDLKAKFVERFGPERGPRITDTDRNLLVFPNLVINDHMAITVRIFWPIDVDRVETFEWALAPKDEAAEIRALRLSNFLMFFGPSGFATPDDIDVLGECQSSATSYPSLYSDYSRGYGEGTATDFDDSAARAFWRRWHELILSVT